MDSVAMGVEPAVARGAPLTLPHLTSESSECTRIIFHITFKSNERFLLSKENKTILPAKF